MRSSITLTRRERACASLAVVALAFGSLALAGGRVDTAEAAEAYAILVSQAPARTGATTLDGQSVSGVVYVFTSPETGVRRVRFYLDDPQRTGSPRQTENNAPYDFAGTAPDRTANPFDTSTLTDGSHTITAAVERTDGVTDVVYATFTKGTPPPPPPPPSTYAIQFSAAADRSNDTPLDGTTQDGIVYVFTSPETGVTRVRFWLDDPNRTGPPRQTESNAPYDFAGTASDRTANPFDTSSIAPGDHTITAAVDRTDGTTDVLQATFSVAGAPIEPGPPDQVHLAWVGDPSTTLTVVWRTLDPSVPSTAEHRPVGATTWTQTTGALRPSGADGSLREATITGLAPDTAYEYRVPGDGGVLSQTFTTRTAPAPGPADFDAVYVADTGLIGRTDGLASGTEQVRDEIAALAPTLVLGGGDYAYFDTDKRYGTLEDTIDAWFDQMEPVATRSPLMPTYGNHEALLGEGYANWAARFPTPTGFDGRRNYSFRVGDVHFVSIFAVYNSQGLTQGQLDWIEADIDAAKASGARWVVPYMHAPPFSDGSNHPSNLALRSQLGPLFERLGVDVVLTSHDQSYERTYPLVDVPASNTPTSSDLRCYTKADGVTWVKISPGGKRSNINGSFSSWLTTPPPPWTATRDNTQHHFSRLVASASGDLRLDTYGVVGDGTPPVIVDTFRYTTGTCPSSLAFSPGSVSMTADEGGTAQTVASLDASNGSASYTVTDDASWLTVSPTSGATPATLTLTADATGLTPGTHTATLEASSPGNDPASLAVTFTVTPGVGVALPYALDFSSDRGGIADRDGTGTGFRWVDPPSNGAGYVPGNLDLDGGVLRITTTAGLAFRTANAQDNALAVAYRAQDGPARITTVLRDLPTGSKRFEQAGLWFGRGEDDHVKLVVMSASEGPVIEALAEWGGVDRARTRSGVVSLTAPISLHLRTDPTTSTVTASYRVGTGPEITLGAFTVPSSLFPDGYGGIFASHRNASAPLVYTFDSFDVG